IVVVVVFFRPVTRRSLRRSLRSTWEEHRRKGQFSDVWVRVDADGVTRTDAAQDFHVRWAAVDRVIASDSVALIYTGRNTLILVPRHAFPNEAEFVHFVETCRQYQEESSSESPGAAS